MTKLDSNNAIVLPQQLSGLILQYSSDIIIVIHDDNLIEFNPSAELFFNIKKNDVYEKSYLEIPAIVELLRAIDSNSPPQKKIFHQKWKYQVLDRYKIIVGSLTNYDEIQNKFEQVITEKEKIEDEKKTLAQYLQDIISTVPGSIYWKNKKGIYLGCNEFMAETAGLSASDIIGKSDYELWPEQAKRLRDNDLNVMRLGQPISVEEEVILPTGKKRYFIVAKMPLRDAQGKLNGIIGNSMEITNIKEIQGELELANNAKTEFIANMSHDIRTPLTGVIGLSELLEQSLDNPEHKEEAHLLHNSGEELLNMLNAILDTVQANKLDDHSVNERAFNLHQCIEDLVKLERPTTTLKHLGLNVDIGSDIPQCIVSDKTKIHRILLNLIGNAIKFTQSGHITISVSKLEENDNQLRLEFKVSDTGIGIAEEAQKKVFDKFFRATPSYKGIYKGNGLGLHIVQSYINLLKGHITLTSKEQVGTTFSFDIWCGKDIKNTSVLEDQKSHFLPLNNNTHYSASPRIPLIHFLLIEDNPTALRVLESLISAMHYSFTSAPDAETALELFNSNHFDCIITDIGLPGISGIQLTSTIRELEQQLNRKKTLIIGLTGHAQQTARSECLACGMDDVINKPATIPIIKTSLDQLLAQDIQTNDDALSLNNNSSLGFDLSNTEDELFDLSSFLIFDVAHGLNQLNDMTLLSSLVKDYVSDIIQSDV
ncbi:MAG: ATP-binding protein, partial [Legionella sp.]